MNFRVICKLLGILVMAFTTGMIAVLPCAVWYGEVGPLIAVLKSMGIGLGIGLGLFAIGRNDKQQVFRREALAVVGLSWLVAAGIGALPFYLGGMTERYADAYFESMSGLTTTGSSILTDIEGQARSMLFWRSFLQFLGGIGIIVFFIAIMPIFGVGGKALFKQEVSGPVPEGLTPRIKDTAIQLMKIYLAFNLLLIVLLWLAGMSPFDAVNHAFATVSSGGFSTRNDSALSFNPVIQWILVIFMVVGTINFSLHLMFFKGELRAYIRSMEFRVFIGIIVIASLLVSLLLYLTSNTAVSVQGGYNLRDAFFTTVSILTTTGFGTVNFDQWPPVCKYVLVLLMFVGGMAGSTSGSIKVVRWIVLIKCGVQQMALEAAPHEVKTLKLDSRVIDHRVQRETLVFFFIYMLTFMIGTLLITLLMPNQPLLDSISAVAATLNNIGPGLGSVGPYSNFAAHSDAAKWVFSLLMILGRLELYAIMVILAPRFWVPK